MEAFMPATNIAATEPHDHAHASLPDRPLNLEATRTSQPTQGRLRHPPSGLPVRRIHGDLNLNPSRRLILILSMGDLTVRSQDEASDVAGLLVTYDHEGLRDIAATLRTCASNIILDVPDGDGPGCLTLSCEAPNAFVERIHLVVTHGDPTLRRRIEPQIPGLRDLPWICSRAGIDWGALGVDDTRLGYILSRAGMVTDLSRPDGFCLGLLTALTANIWPRVVEPPFARLLSSLFSRRARVDVTGPTYGHRDVLKQRGYRWSDGRGRLPRGWFVFVPRSVAMQEVAWINWRLGPDGVVATIREIDG